MSLINGLDLGGSMETHLKEWFVSVSEFAKAVKVTPQAIRKGIKENRIMASKIGHQWVIPKQLIEQWIKSD